MSQRILYQQARRILTSANNSTRKRDPLIPQFEPLGGEVESSLADHRIAVDYLMGKPPGHRQLNHLVKAISKDYGALPQETLVIDPPLNTHEVMHVVNEVIVQDPIFQQVLGRGATIQTLASGILRGVITDGQAKHLHGRCVDIAEYFGQGANAEVKAQFHKIFEEPIADRTNYLRTRMTHPDAPIRTEIKYAWDERLKAIIYDLDDEMLKKNPARRFLVLFHIAHNRNPLLWDTLMMVSFGVCAFQLGKWDLFNDPSNPKSTHNLQYNPTTNAFEPKRIFVEKSNAV